ncbi:MFS transporter [Clostridium sediminicola]|uniref:MFS transporter n=1 Tax=Clostridium sediminicola TaxID=3114879 RepID=UPI0031F1C7BB
MNYKDKLKNNIKLNYIFIFLSRLNLTQGLWMIYLAFKGMSLLQLGVLEGIYHITSFLMEVPTGAVADIFGRKVSRVLGRVGTFISTILLIYSNSFYMFALSFIIQALGNNLESGAGEALIYDSLKELGEEDSFIKVNGKNEMVMQISSVCAFLLGGYLATKSYFFTFWLSAVFVVVTFSEATLFEEPIIIKENKKDYNVIKVLKNQLTNSISVIRGNMKIGFLIIFSEVIGAFCTSLFFYLQNYWKTGGYTEFKIGIILSVTSIISALVASKVHVIEKILKEKGILIIMPLVFVICAWGAAITKYQSVFFIIMSAVEVIIFVTTSDYINKLIPSENRATIISFQSMVFSFFMIVIFPLVGKLGDSYSLIFSFKILAILATLFMFANFYVVGNTKR